MSLSWCWAGVNDLIPGLLLLTVVLLIQLDSQSKNVRSKHRMLISSNLDALTVLPAGKQMSANVLIGADITCDERVVFQALQPMFSLDGDAIRRYLECRCWVAMWQTATLLRCLTRGVAGTLSTISYARVTLAACRPLLPCSTLNSTR